MSYDYSENILVQESAGNLLRDELGWDVRFAYNTEILGKNGTFGRESYKEIVLYRYFRETLKKLNPWINDSQISEAQKLFPFRQSAAQVFWCTAQHGCGVLLFCAEMGRRFIYSI